MSQMPTLIILAGGASSRMWPLQEKSLIRFGEDPLLISQLQRYQSLGFEQVIIVGNPANQGIIQEATAGLANLNVQVVVQSEPKGMGDALLQIIPALSDLNAPIYITQVHDVVDVRLHETILKAFQKDPGVTYLAGYEMEDYFPGGYLIVDGERITGIIEKPGPENKPSNLVSFVAHLHQNAGRLLEAVRAEYAKDIPSDDHYERAMAGLMAESVFKVVPYSGHWSALKFPWHVLDIMNYFLDQIDGQQVAESAYVSDKATLLGNVFIGENARIFPGAAVVGPAYIGANTIVGNNALVRNSMVLDHCEVGFTTEIARSYVADHVAMHACRVLDSVFAPHVNFSAGCTTANLRIDHGDVPTMVKGQKMSSGRDKLGAIIGQNAFLGVDVMTMPGVKIGERAQVGPGTNVLNDVQDGQRVYVKQELIIVEEPKNG